MDDYIEVHNDIAKGGDWLRAARIWMQSNVARGAVAVAAVLAERRKTPNVRGNAHLTAAQE